MILLLGGTTETAGLAEALAEAGWRVLVSTATGMPIDVGSHPAISRRCGRLTENEMTALIRDHEIRALVDATHPYAEQVRTIAPRVASALGIPYLAFMRPETSVPAETVRLVPDHEHAATAACAGGKPVLLTIGCTRIDPYVREAQRTGTDLVVRALPQTDSIEKCREAGIPDSRIVPGRGPFSVEDNRRVIRQFGVGVLVTKDGGSAGGVNEKLEAARLEGCAVVMVARPQNHARDTFSSFRDIIEALTRADALPARAGEDSKGKGERYVAR